MIHYEENTFTYLAFSHLSKDDIEDYIKKYAEKNNLVLYTSFSREDYKFFTEIRPEEMTIRYKIDFMARKKTQDEILGDQIEFQIKQLEL